MTHRHTAQRRHRNAARLAGAREDVAIADDEGALQWFWGPQSATRGQRGFCGRCGSSLFWRTPDRPTISVTAGTLDGVTGLRTVQHIWDEQRADWEVVDDVPRSPRGT